LDEGQEDIAPDGFYMIDDVYRQLLDGVLLENVRCNGCTPESFCFDGVWEEGEEHPDGGSVTYVDENGDTIVLDMIFLGDKVSVTALEILSYTGVVPSDCPSDFLYILSEEEGAGCGYVPTTECQISQVNPVMVTSGDIIYELSGTSLIPLNGGGLFYTISNGTIKYVVSISTEGVITVNTPCA
jgi:hypothetical protein